MTSTDTIRVNMRPAGSYVSAAASFESADHGIKHVLKMGYTTRGSDRDANPSRLETTFSSDHVLLDFTSLMPDELDPDKIIADCDLVKDVASRHPELLRQMVDIYTSAPTGFDRANDIAEQIGLTEDASVKTGGGIAWVAVVVIIALMSRACADAGKGNPQGKPKQ